MLGLKNSVARNLICGDDPTNATKFSFFVRAGAAAAEAGSRQAQRRHRREQGTEASVLTRTAPSRIFLKILDASSADRKFARNARTTPVTISTSRPDEVSDLRRSE